MKRNHVIKSIKKAILSIKTFSLSLTNFGYPDLKIHAHLISIQMMKISHLIFTLLKPKFCFYFVEFFDCKLMIKPLMEEEGIFIALLFALMHLKRLFVESVSP